VPGIRKSGAACLGQGGRLLCWTEGRKAGEDGVADHQLQSAANLTANSAQKNSAMRQFLVCYAMLLAAAGSAAFAPDGAQRRIGMVVPVDSAFVGGPIAPGIKSGINSMTSPVVPSARRTFCPMAMEGGARLRATKLRNRSRRRYGSLNAGNPDDAQNVDVEVVGSEPAVFDPLGLGGPGGGGGQDIDQVMQQQALWMSAKTGDVNGIAQAASKGADVNHKYTGEGMASAIQCAALNGNTEAVAKLASLGADVNQVDQYKWTALHDAALNGHTDTVVKLVELGANINAQTDVEDEAPGAGLRTALSNAAMNGHTETVRKIAALGADVNTKQKDGWSSLHFAAKNGWEETVEALVTLGISPNVKNEVDMTPLHYAAWDATVETCQKLIDLGLSPYPLPYLLAALLTPACL
jgi:hypothetical protein